MSLEPVLRVGRTAWSLLREATGEAEWDRYLDRCAAQGGTPMSRRTFERHRADHREQATRDRCC